MASLELRKGFIVPLLVEVMQKLHEALKSPLLELLFNFLGFVMVLQVLEEVRVYGSCGFRQGFQHELGRLMSLCLSVKERSLFLSRFQKFKALVKGFPRDNLN